MHHALYLEEILLNIFGHLYSSSPHTPRAHFVVLARTCKAFKEPALDMIWARICNLRPLVRCLPEELWIVNEPERDAPLSLKKPLGQAEWDIILGYTYRVRILNVAGSSGLAADSIEALSKAPVTGSIFPKLWAIMLHNPSVTVAPLLQHFAHSNVTLIFLSGGEILGTAIDTFRSECPFVTDFHTAQWTDKDALPGLVRHWKNLRSLSCDLTSLDVHTLSHLSRLRNLIRMSFETNDAHVDQIHAVQSLTTALTFPALRDLDLNSKYLAPIWRLIRYLRLPVIRSLSVDLRDCFTAPDLLSFFALLREASPNNSLMYLTLRVCSLRNRPMIPTSPLFHLTFDRLRPLTIFSNIKSITLDIPCGMDLNEHEFLTLASSWPHLESFEVAGDHDWTPSSALTLAGFLQLLEICRSLRVLHFMFDVRGYTEIPQGHPWRGLTMPQNTFINLLCTPIEEESIRALGVFFHVAPYPNFGLSTRWNNIEYRISQRRRELCDLYYDRWVRARGLARDLWQERRSLRYSLEA